ncbi:MAG TPA: hypothetical protein VJ837_01015 [Candidatus Paceibacterota bacterium]|nr:hypothetical protein [Candidatus Paceibacterota bacterium]
MKHIDVVAAVLVVVGAGLVGVAGLHQAVFWKRVQSRWMRPAGQHA